MVYFIFFLGTGVFRGRRVCKSRGMDNLVDSVEPKIIAGFVIRVLVGPKGDCSS